MKCYLPAILSLLREISRATRNTRIVATLSACLFFIGCAARDMTDDPSAQPGQFAQTPANFDAALKLNQTALFERKGAPDVALYNIGFILSHPANPKKDPPKAMHLFKTLVTEHPRSKLADPAKAWIQVLEQQQKNAEERQRLVEEKRVLSREREMLSQERQKLNYASEKSQQLDVEIEKRRRQSLGR